MKKMNFTFSKLRSFMSFLGLVSILSWSSSTLDAQTMNCANTTINLLAGECTTNFTPNIIATAPAAPGYTTWETTMPTGLTPSVSPGAAAGTSGQSNVYFDLQNTSGSIKQFWGMTFFTNSTIPAPAGTVYKVYRTTNPGSYGGANRTTAANWTLIGTFTSTAVATSGEAININFSSPVNFGIGASYGFYVESSNIAAASIVYSTTAPASIAFAGGLTFFAGTGGAGVFSSLSTFGTPNPSATTPAVPAAGTFRRIVAAFNWSTPPSTLIGTLANGIVTQTGGPAIGSPMAAGNHTLTFTATDPAGVVPTTSCSMVVTVVNFENQPGNVVNNNLVCNQLANISLDEDCRAVITPGMILVGGPYACLNRYVVTVMNENGTVIPAATVTRTHIDRTLQVKVTDPTTGNTCWGYIRVEDKMPPVLTCTDLTIDCNDPVAPLGSYNSAQTNFIPTAPRTGSLVVSNNVPVQVVDNSCGTMTFNVNAGYPISVTDLNLSLNFDHTWLSDNVITLTSPNGTVFTLLDGVCGGPFPINTTFDDECTNTSTLCADLATATCFRPTFGPLSIFDGGTGNGAWTLSICDDAAGDVGTIISASLSISYVERAPTAPAVAENCSSYSLTYRDVVNNQQCTGDCWKTITRTWTAVDASSYRNVGTCVQTICFKKLAINGLAWPSNYDGLAGSLSVLECKGPWDVNGNNYPDVTETGKPGGDACNIQCTWRDEVIKVCGDDASTSAIEGTFKVLRFWTCLDWCTGETATHLQIIKVGDHGSPVVACPVYPTRALQLGLGGAPGNLVASEGTNVTLSTDYNTCLSSYNFPAATFTDACGSAIKSGWLIGTDATSGAEAFRINTNGGIVRNIPVGNYNVCYYLEDMCGNVGSCCMNVAVRDYVSPVAICKTYLTIGLGDNGRGRIYATDFDNGSYDNCAIVSWKVRRMSDPCHTPAITTLRDTVAFCCTDVNKKIAVVMRVTDANGNYNECMDSVLVQDKLPPIITCPPDINIDCRYPYSLSNLDIFGTVVNGGRGTTAVTRDPIFIDQRYGHIGRHSESDQNPHFQVGVNGVAFDNCSLTLSYSQSPDIFCNRGRITRTWIAADAAGSRSCVQYINIYNTYEFSGADFFVLNENSGQPPYDVPFVNYNSTRDYNWDDMHDIYWPADYTTNQCGAALDTANIPWPYKKPWFREDVCSNVGVGYDDWYFDFEVGSSQGCKKVIRKWKVIDWCQRDDEGNHPSWMYDQVLVVMNSSAPTFTNCAPVSWCHNGPACGPHHQALSITATDDCDPETKLRYRYQVDLNNDGTFDSFGTGSTIDPAAGWVLGTHRVVWEVEDGCGNKETCTQILTIKDCKKPSPVCIELIAELMPTTCMIELWASDFIAGNSSTDNCPGPYTYTFDAAGTQANRIFTLADVGRVPVNIYMWDAAGNSDFCITTATIQNNMPCGSTASRLLTGTVKTELNNDVRDAKVSIMDNNNSEIGYRMSTTTGEYAFDPMVAANQTVVPSRDDNHRNGISTADIIAIQKHILGSQALTTGYKMIAADVNKSNSITAADLVELRKLVLFKIDRFANNTSFRFVDKSYNLTTGNVFSASFPEKATLTSTQTGNVFANFVAVKIGDVNDNAVVNLTGTPEERSGKTLSFNVADANYTAGETVKVTMNAASFNNINGYQFTTNFDNQRLEFVGFEAGKLNINDDNFGFTMLENGKITTSWSNPTAVSVNDNEGLFTLVFKARSNGTVSESVYATSEVTNAQAYNAAGEIMNVGLNFIGKDGVAVQGFALYQNQPNPWGTETLIGFNLPESMKAKVSVYDVTGKVIKVVERTFNKGYNSVTLNKGELPATGVMYYQLDAADFSAAKKMIILE
jgi:subtilisin-like proprotein convertase family protein